jgi:hypothetical protein
MSTRTAINPTSWSINLGFDQAELVEGHQRLLVCSAQDAMDADGTPQHFQQVNVASGTRATRPPCSASRSYQRRSSS